jgi:hypothetical protein
LVCNTYIQLIKYTHPFKTDESITYKIYTHPFKTDVSYCYFFLDARPDFKYYFDLLIAHEKKIDDKLYNKQKIKIIFLNNHKDSTILS